MVRWYASGMTHPDWKTGTAWDSPSWPCRLLCYDYAQDIEDVAALPQADIIFADPPYNIGLGYADDPDKDKMPLEAYQRHTKRWMLQLAKMARPGATFWWMVPEEHADWVGATLSNIIGPRLYRIVWEESFSQYQGDRALTKDYRFIFVHECFKDGSQEVTFNPHDIRVKSVRQQMGDKRANPKGRVPGTTWRFSPELTLEQIKEECHMLCCVCKDGGQQAIINAALDAAARVQSVPGDIWKFRRLQGTSNDRVDWHPAQLPPELLARIVKGWSNPGGQVIDGFAGSGSLARVCRSLGRSFLGIERSPTYLTKMMEGLA